MAVGVLAIGMIFIGGVFPVAIYFTTIATERTIAAAATDEAFAKIRLYAIGDPANILDDVKVGILKEYELTDFNDSLIRPFPATANIEPNEFTYPSTAANIKDKQYCWSALCRLTETYDPAINPNPPVQVTVFVCRKIGGSMKYYARDPVSGEVDWLREVDGPVPVKVKVNQAGLKNNELRITNLNPNEWTFINDGYTIVDDKTGRLYRVLERYPSQPDTILLDRYWDNSPPGGSPDMVWVVPPPVNGGRGPCIAVYQKVIKF